MSRSTNSQSDNQTDTWLRLGTVGKPHGVRGAFFVAERDEALPKLSVVRLDHPDQSRDFRVLSCKTASGGRPVLQVGEITSREEIAEYSGKEVWCPRRAISFDPQQEYFWADLQNVRVVDSEGTYMGTICQVYNCGASDILTIKSDSGTLELPLVHDYFDMTFSDNVDVIHLKVPAEHFSELWQDLDT